MPDGAQQFEIKPAVRIATPALISLWGPSGAGKTLSALKLARGLVGPNGKIGLIDTENRRALFYAKEAGGWDHLDLQPPFTPERYTAALRAFEDQGGYGCVIVDSMSHVWEGEGGVLDMADNARTQSGRAMQGLGKWKAPKMAYKRMLNGLLRAPMHVIFCLRAKDGHKQTGNGEEAIEHTGLEPISEKGFIFEMTISVLLGPDHKPMFTPDERFKIRPLIPIVKAPEEVSGAIQPGEYLSEKTGNDIAAWINGAVKLDAALEALKRTARDVATMGTDKLALHWKSLKPADQRKLEPIKAELKLTAEQADQNTSDDDLPSDPPPAKSADPFKDKFTDQPE